MNYCILLSDIHSNHSYISFHSLWWIIITFRKLSALNRSSTGVGCSSKEQKCVDTFLLHCKKSHHQLHPLPWFQNFQISSQMDNHIKWVQVVWFLVTNNGSGQLPIFFFFFYLHLRWSLLEKIIKISTLKHSSASSFAEFTCCSFELPSSIFIAPFAPRGGV